MATPKVTDWTAAYKAFRTGELWAKPSAKLVMIVFLSWSVGVMCGGLVSVIQDKMRVQSGRMNFGTEMFILKKIR